MLFVFYSKHPTLQVDVYSGPVLNGTHVGHSAIYHDGTVSAFIGPTSACFDTVEVWCDTMIETMEGSKLYLISNTYYGDDAIIKKLYKCQEKMIGLTPNV